MRRRLVFACGTWNVNATQPDGAALADLLGPADVYVVCLQETVHLAKPWSYLRSAPPWAKSLGKALPDCRLVASRQLVGVLLVVLAKRGLELAADTCRVAVGQCGLGNKGACCVSLDFGHSTVALVGAHLSPFTGPAALAARNEQFVRIGDQAWFPTAPHTLAAHDEVVWLGDLNYRVALPDDEARRLAEAATPASLNDLRSGDELKRELHHGHWQGFEELPLGFPPTYKYDKRSVRYDSSPKRRGPAWCDRILWRSSAFIEAAGYARHELLASDHRPVTVQLTVAVQGGPPRDRRRTCACFAALRHRLERLVSRPERYERFDRSAASATSTSAA